jgi:hypothetical protein
MPDAEELWFDAPPRPTCANHDRAAESVCSRCGGFQCELCETPTARELCHACAVTVTEAALPSLSRRAAWKLLLLPFIGIACLIALASRGAPLHRLNAEQLTFLSAWLVPFACGLGLLVRPRAGFAFVGALAALALVCAVLIPPAIAELTLKHALDLLILSAAPLVALRDAFALDRTHRHRHLLHSMALS